MPDVHAGTGCVIGFTADLGEKVIPNLVGVDIGCGVLVTPLYDYNSGKKEPVTEIDFEKLDTVIRKNVPSGHEIHDEEHPGIDEMLNRLHAKSKLKNISHIRRSAGTLGGGNHFIEIDRQATDFGMYYLVIHTGSRNLGKQVAGIYQEIAVKEMSGQKELNARCLDLIQQYKSEHREKEIFCALEKLKGKWRKEYVASVPKDLSYLTGESRREYLHDMRICQDFATMNRDAILKTICMHMGWNNPSDLTEGSFHTVHNYIDFGYNIIRKGAVSAEKSQQLAIPMNMRDGTLLCIGKGNPDWNYSAPHGAGRLMSRSSAKENISLEEYIKSMYGVWSTSVSESTIDESPMAYKPIREILDVIGETVEVYDVLRPVYNFKAS